MTTKPHTTSSQPPSQRRMISNGSAPLRLLQVLAAVVWATVLALGVGRFKLAAKPPLKVAVKVKPEAVRLFIDGQKYQDGAYIKTPVIVDMAPGKHRLKISRDGYVAQVTTVEGDSNELIKMDEMMLEMLPGAAMASADIVVRSGEPEMHVEIDDGFVSGTTPLAIDDLAENQPHTLTVYPSWPELEPLWRCRFKTGAAIPAEPVVIELTNGGRRNRLTASNCQKLKAARPRDASHR